MASSPMTPRQFLGKEHYQRLAEVARTPEDGPVPAWFEDYREAERAGQSLLIWSPIVIPGLLQRLSMPASCSWHSKQIRRTKRSTRW